MKFTPAIKVKITNDWSTLFPSFDIYEPLQLIRRVGCLIQGICLNRNRSNDNYVPTIHIYSLCRKHPGIALTTAQPLKSLRGYEESVSVSRHDAALLDTASRLEKASILPLEGTWKYSEMENAIELYRKCTVFDKHAFLLFIEDVAYTASFYNHINLGHLIFDKYHDEIKLFEDRVFAFDDNFVSWDKRVRREIECSSNINAIVNEKISRLKLESIQFSPILFK